MRAANDNRTPAEHRAYVEAQRQHQPKGEPKHVKNWPQGTRYIMAGKFEYMRALNDWNTLNGEPQVCIANDNFQDGDTEEQEETPRPSFDNRMDTETAASIIRRYKAGKSWQPDDERFERPHRNSPERSIAAGTFKMNGVSLYTSEANAEDEAIRGIDCKRIRERLGDQTCDILDMAGGDASLEEIGDMIGCGRKTAASRVDEAIANYLAIAA